MTAATSTQEVRKPGPEFAAEAFKAVLYGRATSQQQQSVASALILANGVKGELLAALKEAERVLAEFANAVGGNEQHRDHGEFFKGYNAVTRKVGYASSPALPDIRAAIAKASGEAK